MGREVDHKKECALGRGVSGRWRRGGGYRTHGGEFVFVSLGSTRGNCGIVEVNEDHPVWVFCCRGSFSEPLHFTVLCRKSYVLLSLNLCETLGFVGGLSTTRLCQAIELKTKVPAWGTNANLQGFGKITQHAKPIMSATCMCWSVSCVPVR